MDIAQEQEPDYETARIDTVGFVDPYGLEGLIVLRSDDGREFHVRAFSGEVARHVAYMTDDDEEIAAQAAEYVPSIYGMVSEICEANEMMLVKAKIYESGSVLRASMYLTGKRGDLVLKNYRASDAIALAALYKIPILVRNSLLKDPKDEAETPAAADKRHHRQ